MDFGVTFQTDPPRAGWSSSPQRAEPLGFSHAWTFDSHILWQEPYVIHAQMLAATERIIVGPFVTNPATRDPRSPPRCSRRSTTPSATARSAASGAATRRAACWAASRRRSPRPSGDPCDQGARRGPRDRDAGRRGADPVGARRQARRLDGGLRAEGARAGRPHGRRLHPPARRPGDPRVDARRVRAAPRRPGRDPDSIAVCVAAPAYVGDDLAHAREQCRWFGGMVGNHVADLVRATGRDGEIPRRADRLHPRAARATTTPHHGRAGNPDTEFVPDEIVDRFCVLGTAEDHVAKLRELRVARRQPVQHLPHARRAGGDAGRLRGGGHPGAGPDAMKLERVGSLELRAALRHADPGDRGRGGRARGVRLFRAVVPRRGRPRVGGRRDLLAAPAASPVATGILNIRMHDPEAVASSCQLGPTTRPVHARPGDRPRGFVRKEPGSTHAVLDDGEYLDALDAACLRCRSTERILAALKPECSELARDRSPARTRTSPRRAHRGRARAARHRPAPSRPSRRRARDRPAAPAISPARTCPCTSSCPNYRGNLLAPRLRRDDLADGGSDRLVDALVAWGDEEAIADRVRAHRDAGADHVCIQVVGVPQGELPLGEWRALAPALIG